MRSVVPLALVAACLATGLGAAQEPQQIFRGSSDTVRVFVTVTDRDGRLVTTLTRDQFEVRDEGKPQPITVFDHSAQPIRLIVMLDVSGSMEGNLSLLRAASEQLFERLRPDDVVRVGTFGLEVTISPSFTRDTEELRAALPSAIASNAPTPLWRAVDDAIDGFSDEGDARRVILVLSDGKDTGPGRLGQRFVSLFDIVDHAREADVMIYAVGLRSRGAMPAQPAIGREGLIRMLTSDLPDPGLARAALETGGGYLEIRPRDDLGEAFAQVADELHSQYLLGFEPAVRDGKVHDIDVRIAVRGLKSRARKTYLAPKVWSIVVSPGGAMFNRFDEPLRRTLVYARMLATQEGAGDVSPMHLLRGILMATPRRVESPTLPAELEALRSRLAPKPVAVVGSMHEVLFSEVTLLTFDRATEEADRLGHDAIRPGHMLLALAAQIDTPVGESLDGAGVTRQVILACLRGEGE